MRQRTITAFFFAAVMLGGIYGGKYTFFALFGLITFGCSWELLGLMLKQEDQFVTLRRIAGTIPAVLVYLSLGGNALEIIPNNLLISPLIMPALLFAGWALLEMFLASKNPFGNIGSYFLALAYIGIPLGLLTIIVQTQGNWCTVGEDPDAHYYIPHRVFGLLLLVWTNDTGAYLTGRAFGKHKLFERISPKKTWEGTLGGAVLTVLVAWGLSFIIKDFTLPQWLALSVVAAIGSNLGDLVESMLKRSVGVKDSGTFLPGHGGFLDRFDAFIFCLPFFWLVLRLV
ncbi:MAG: phosphatidate cytidylyltransferase [Phycisphaerae bacterium]|nr:phosphatidate cytidylyltransferase [Saprospiraceae bacterium]